MLAFGITYSLLLILFGLCAEARWRHGGAVAVLVHWELNLTHLLLFTYPMST